MQTKQLTLFDLTPKKPKGLIHYRRATLQRLVDGGCYKDLDKWARYYYNRTRLKGMVSGLLKYRPPKKPASTSLEKTSPAGNEAKPIKNYPPQAGLRQNTRPEGGNKQTLPD